MPSFMTGKRSRLITIAAASTVTVATAVSATAAALPSGSAAVSAGVADSHVLVADQHQLAARAAHGATMSETMSEEQRMILSTRARSVRSERQREYKRRLPGPRRLARRPRLRLPRLGQRLGPRRLGRSPEPPPRDRRPRRPRQSSRPRSKRPAPRPGRRSGSLSRC